ncbi:MAG TPA: hypothetical protein VMV17_08290 [Streptosporangiaceae bacterium]|nr:hypothetical protein [Streptosporangiaceae bacterium]
MTADSPASAGFDPGQRAQAAQIQAACPQWVVLWGCSSRRFWAFPLFAARPGTIVSAPGTGTLVDRMRQAELATAPGRPGHAPAPSPPR